MQIDIEPGAYVVAVSGGVDSMALLHALAQEYRQNPKTYRFVVAHYDHGIRPDSADDRKLVQQSAESYGLPFVYDTGDLGVGTSEAVARKARYAFLERVRRASGAHSIVTAHHKDDVLETALLQFMRGTRRKGWSSLQSGTYKVRPLLGYRKIDLENYAKSNGLVWNEDSTNTDTRYLRNYLRHRVLPQVSDTDKQQLHRHIGTLRSVNEQIDALLTTLLHQQTHIHKLDRQWFIGLPHAVAREVMAQWLRNRGVRDFDKRTIERLVVYGKTLQPGQKTDVGRMHILAVEKHFLALEPRDR